MPHFLTFQHFFAVIIVEMSYCNYGSCTTTFQNGHTIRRIQAGELAKLLSAGSKFSSFPFSPSCFLLLGLIGGNLLTYCYHFGNAKVFARCRYNRALTARRFCGLIQLIFKVLTRKREGLIGISVAFFWFTGMCI